VKTNYSPKLQKQDERIANTKQIVRLWVIVAILEIVAIALGLAFFFIVHAIIFGVAWFALYWRPAHQVYTKALNIQDNEFVRVPIPWWRTVILSVKAIIVIFFLYFGIKTLITNGFLAQNLIYIFVTNWK
jgi:ABC-type arginine transport system permease subunit